MFYGSGHESWIALVLFGGMFALRYFSARRRRGGVPRGGPAAGFFTGPGGHRPPPPGAPAGRSGTDAGTGSTGGSTGSATVSGTVSGTAPGWFRDPFFRHEQRYWSGSEWTEHVTDAEVPGTDPPPPPREPGA